MPNYDKATGNAGTLRIADNGTTVSFIILCSDGATQTGGLSWSGVVNGQNVGGTVSLSPGFGSRTVATYTVASAQTVQFNIGASGTSGLGGPTNHSAAIARGSAPGAPGSPLVTAITSSSAHFAWAAASGVSPVYGLYVSERQDFATHVFAEWVGQVLAWDLSILKPGTKYWTRTRAQNGVGVGPYSSAGTFTTLTGLYVDDGTTFKPASIQVSDGSAWAAAGIQISTGTAWKPSG